MKNRKAHVTLSGEVITKETPAIEYVDEKYLERIESQKKKLKELLFEEPTGSETDGVAS